MDGNSTFQTQGDGSALFIGVSRASADIFRVEFNTAGPSRRDFAINRVDLAAPRNGTVPVPATLALVGLALVAAGMAGRRQA